MGPPRSGDGAGMSTPSLHKLRRFNFLILGLRVAAFAFSFASSIFMVTSNSIGTTKPSDASSLPSLRWYNFESFRYVVVANTIVALYSLFEISATAWEVSRNSTIFPEVLQVWFDYGHDQVLAYLLLSASSTGTTTARAFTGSNTCSNPNRTFCFQSDIAIAFGFVAFMFLAMASLFSGFRVVYFLIKGSRFIHS